jgi:hypothetical protein
MVGGSGNDYVYGHTQSDSLVGGEGRDLIDGWTGLDHMLGGGVAT